MIRIGRWSGAVPSLRDAARLLVPVVVAAAALGLCVPLPSSGQVAGPLVCLDTALSGYGDAGIGWTGGDSTWSAVLPEGREVFAFSDTFLPPVTPPSRPSNAGFVHNSFVVRDPGGRLSTITGGTPDRPDALLVPRDPAHWFWLGAATYLGGALQVPLSEWRSSGAGPIDVAFTGSALARFDPRDLRHPQSITPLPGTRGIQWGQWVQPDGAWTYIYGVESTGGDKRLHVARVAGDDLRDRWSFWTGHDWSDAEPDSVPVADPIGAEFSVHRLHSGVYLLLTMSGNGFGDHIADSYATAPTGPFGPAHTLYTTPETGAAGTYHDPDVYTYNAHVHPEFSTPARLVVSYNVNSVDTAPGGDVYREMSIYRPRFITIDLPGPADGDAVAGSARACP